jgi:DNA-binding MarR family transcriptional regulator
MTSPPDAAVSDPQPIASACAGGNAALAGDERIVLMALLMEAHAHLTRTLGAEMEASCGLPLSWFDVLLNLAAADDHRLTMSTLGASVLLTSGGMTRLVDRMEDAGLVERRHCPSDRRAIWVAMTAEGARRLEEATAEHLRSLDRHLMAPLTATNRTALITALTKLRGPVRACSGR